MEHVLLAIATAIKDNALLTDLENVTLVYAKLDLD
jgi:hypothetical protein